MAYSVKKSQFNGQAIADSPVPRQRIMHGVPVSAQTRGRSVNSIVTILTKNGYMPQDSTPDGSYSAIAELCLFGMGITIEPIGEEESIKTLKNLDSEPQNEADKKNESQRKNYTDDTFPSQDDPYYQMDQAPPNYVTRNTTATRQSMQDSRAIVDLVAQIGVLNSKTMSSLKLKQLVEDK